MPTSSSFTKTNSSKQATTKVPKFLNALYTMLQLEDKTVLAWSHDGTHFQVLDVARLERDVLPKYFNHSKLTSFQRQLNNFGFRKWTKTRANVCTFSHDALVQRHPGQLSALVASLTPVTEQIESNQVSMLKRELSAGRENEPAFNLDFDVDVLLMLVAVDMLLVSLDSVEKDHSETLNLSLISLNNGKEAMVKPLSMQISCERNSSELNLLIALIL